MAHTHDHSHLVAGGAAVLDIGGDVGAMVALLDDTAEGTELFLRREGGGELVHTGVWTRHQHGEHVTAALFCALPEGTYTVLDGDGDAERSSVIKGGEVTEVDLRRAP